MSAMDRCGICFKPAVQLFETGKDGMYACFKCQPLVPEVTIGDNGTEQSTPHASNTNSEEEGVDSSLYCGICHKSFQKNVQLQNHMRNHRAERRFVCTYCNKAFSQSNNLRAHLRIHTNERPFKCSECGKAFTQVTNLNNHVRLHTGERPFVCPEPGCNKAYAQVTNLNQHRKRHLNGRPVESTYDCTVCGEQFEQRNHMYKHRREAHSEGGAAVAAVAAVGAGAACGECGRTFPTQRHVARHVASVHRAGLALDTHRAHENDVAEGSYTCVFSLCGAVLGSAREHTEHLLRQHQLRVLARPARAQRRGRPPKILKDPLEIKENAEFHEVRQITSAGIGAAICVALANADIRVVGLARRPERIDALQSQVRGQGTIASRKCDVSNAEEVEAAFKWIEDTVGAVHVMINNAGVFYSGGFTDVSDDIIKEAAMMATLDINIKGTMLCSRHAVSSMKRHGVNGHVININSLAGHYIPALPTFNVYPSTKHAVTAFSAGLLNELAHYKNRIKVTSLSPGLVLTELAAVSDRDKSLPALLPKDVADAVVYVLSTPPNVNIDELTISSVTEIRL